ncbi:MAG: TonB-dependent receptor [Thiotrichales bacterium]|nr:TonB-dependent receptor [Thiotrichales bacterium]
MAKSTFRFTPLTHALVALFTLPAATNTLANSTEIEAVTVTATSPVPGSPNQTPVPELQTQSNSETGTALRQIPGVDAIRMGGHGVDLSIRGQSLSQLNILLDGAKIEGGCPNRMDPPTAYAELSSYDSITVIKGVGTLTQAAGGTGGTVLFERAVPTYHPEKPLSGIIQLGGSDNGLQHDLNARVQAVGEKGFIVLQGSEKQADNYQDGNGDEVRSSYDSWQGHVDLGWTPSANHLLKLSYEQSVIEDALFQGAGMDSPESDGRTTRLQYRGKNLTDGLDALELDVYHSEVDHLMDNYSLRPLNPNAMKMLNQTEVSTDGLKLKLRSNLGNTALEYGLQSEIIQKVADLKNGQNKIVWQMWPEVKTQTNSVFAEATTQLNTTQKWIYGLRYDRFTAKADSADQSSETGNPPPAQVYQSVYGVTQTDNQANKLSALLRYEQQLNDHTEFFAGISRAYRFADATELYIIKGSSWTGNPGLKPEAHNQVDVGLAQSFRDFSWQASAYYDRVDDYILSYLQGSNQRYENVDAELYGIELNAEYQLLPNLKTGFNSHLAYGSNRTDNRFLANMTPLSGQWFTQYQKGETQAGARLNFARAHNNVDTNQNEVDTAGWATLDLYSQFGLHKQATLLLGIDNVFDKAYQNALNRVDPLSGNLYKLNEPGRTAWAKVKVTF